jgi:hypothetical protein
MLSLAKNSVLLRRHVDAILDVACGRLPSLKIAE